MPPSSSPVFIEFGSIKNSCLPPPSSLTHTALCFYIYLCPRTGQNKMQGPAGSQHPVRGRTGSLVAQQRAQQNTSLRLPALSSSSSSFGCLPPRSPQLPIPDSRNALFFFCLKKDMYLYLPVRTYLLVCVCVFVYASIISTCISTCMATTGGRGKSRFSLPTLVGRIRCWGVGEQDFWPRELTPSSLSLFTSLSSWNLSAPSPTFRGTPSTVAKS